GIVDARPFLEAFGLLIALPLALAWVTEAKATNLKRALAPAPVPLMALTLLVVVASQIPLVRDDFGAIAGTVPLFAAFLAIMALVGRTLARALRFEPAAGRALLFTGATRNSLVVLPLALALDESAYALAPAVVVTQTLVEVLGMVVYVRAVPKLI